MLVRNVAFAIAMAIGATPLAAQSEPPDPWKKVPPLPTTCYGDLAVSAKLHSTYIEVGEDLTKQEQINSALERELERLGQEEIMKRMMDYMRKDPQKAMKMMQAQQSAATAIREGFTSGDEAKKEREAELEKLSAEFNAELDAMSRPYRTRRDAIMKTSRRVLGEENWEFTTRAAETEYDSLIDRENADYEARCAAYFGPDGKMHAWLASYRKTAIDPAAKSNEANDEIKTTQMAVLESPGAGFRSTAQMMAVREYVLAAEKVFALRRDKIKNVH